MASDINRPLIALLKGIVNGWTPPGSVIYRIRTAVLTGIGMKHSNIVLYLPDIK
jgi:hypothetical protein